MAIEAPTIALFGPVTCRVGPREVSPPPGKPSLLLGLLAMEAGQRVQISTVIDALWADEPPASARALVHTYVSALRRALDLPGTPNIETLPGGYRLDCDPADVDVHRFLRAPATDEPSVWQEALALSRPPLLGGADVAFIQPWRVRVEAARDLLQDRLWEDAISHGRGSDVLPELRAAVASEPLREDRVLLLARALGGGGRTDEALKVLDRYRRQLGEQLGLDPSLEVATLRHALLVGKSDTAPTDVTRAPSEDPSQPARTETSARSRRRVVATVVAGVVAAVVLAAVLGWRWADDRSETVGDIAGPTMISVDPSTGELVDALALPVEPAQIESAGDLVAVRSEVDQAVALVDLGAGDSVKVIGLSAPPSALAMDGEDAVVGLGFSGETVTVTDGRVGPPISEVEGEAGRLTLASSDDGVWVATIRGDVQAPPGTPGWSSPVTVEAAPLRVAAEGSRAWVLTSGRSELVALLSGHAPPVRSPLRGEGVDLTTDGSAAWIVTSGDDRLWHAAATSGRVVSTRVLPGPPAAVLAHGDRVWVAIASPASVIAFDPETLQPGTVVDLPREPVDLAVVSERLVVAVR